MFSISSKIHRCSATRVFASVRSTQSEAKLDV
jgi:hypothetical protein